MIEVREIESRVRAFTVAHIPSLAVGRALVAVSGGGDSVATAALLCESGVLDPKQSTVGHFDHRLRGEDASSDDQAAVEALGARYGFDLVVGSWDRPRQGEAAARDARYAFLAEAAGRRGLPAVVTGHTADDQAETVLMHAMRGAGLHGLRGMAAEVRREKRDVGGGIVIARPMLGASREETRAYCDALGLTFVDDETNLDTKVLRNRVRLEILPAMEAAVPGTRGAMLRLAEESRDAVAALEEIAAPTIIATADGSVVLSRGRLRSMPAAVRPYAFRLAIERLLGDALDIEWRHYTLLAAAVEARTGAVFELPRGLMVTVDADAVVVSRGLLRMMEIPVDFEAPLPFAGVVGMWHLRVAPVVGGPGVRLPAGAVVRRRRSGDRMRLRGGSKKLQDVFVDLKVPRRERDATPVIALGGEVFWVPQVVATEVERGMGEAYEVAARTVGGG
jgi:tRNA(Ile)-lysidine synthase